MRDDDGEYITADRCPVRELSKEHIELIHAAAILIEYGTPLETGGQLDQPIGFYETAAVIKSYQHHLQEAASKRDAKTGLPGNTPG